MGDSKRIQRFLRKNFTAGRSQNGKIRIGDILLSTVAVALVLVILVSMVNIFVGLHAEEVIAPTEAERKTLYRDGVAYFPKQNMTTLLAMGIDRYGEPQDSGSYNNPGDADMVMLLVFDEEEKACTVLALNRDSMVEMPILGIGGKQAGTKVQQLTLAHTYGSGLEDSCENVVNTVSDLLYGVQIDYYVSMSMDVIPLLNDAVGGVAVNVTEDFSDVDSTIPMGKHVLQGQQALYYVQSRKEVGDQRNLSRMQRQEEYLKSFVAALQRKVDESSSFAMKTYEKAEKYLVTNCSGTVLSNMASRLADTELTEIVTPAGENIKGETYMEFYIDEESLDELILELLYEPKQ